MNYFWFSLIVICPTPFAECSISSVNPPCAASLFHSSGTTCAHAKFSSTALYALLSKGGRGLTVRTDVHGVLMSEPGPEVCSLTTAWSSAATPYNSKGVEGVAAFRSRPIRSELRRQSIFGRGLSKNPLHVVSASMKLATRFATTGHDDALPSAQA